MLPHQLELLSPARDADIGIEAIRHGADAVYIGGPAYGARVNAANSVQDIARLAEFAHRYHARIFVTQNTILRDDELEPVRRQIWQLYEAGIDALIIQDMGLLQLDLPPLQLHASTQTDIRTPEKARFLQDVGFSQIVLARELDLEQIAAIRAATDPARCNLEHFIHGALCVAYSGQCYISHASTGRSANRGDCSQACRLPWQVTDSQNRIVAKDKHVLSMKDNDQSANLEALIDAGIRSFKIEGRYKDMGYVKNITAHYRSLLDGILEQRPELAPGSSGQCQFSFTPDPGQNFNRGSTDYFTHGRQQTIGAFDSPKNPGRPIGYVRKVNADSVDLMTDDTASVLHNGDGLCYHDLRNNLVGLQINRAEALGQAGHWRVFPKDPIASLRDLRPDTIINRNRDMDWVRTLERPSAERRIGVWIRLEDNDDGVHLQLIDPGFHAVRQAAPVQFAIGCADVVGDPGAILVSAWTGTGQHHVIKTAVDADFAAGRLQKALQGLAQGLVQAKVFRAQHHARIGAPPEYRLVIAVPGEDALGIGHLQGVGVQHTAGGQQAGVGGAVVQRLRG